MSEVKTLVTLVLGGMFDHNELGDIDLVYEAPACEALQRELVDSIDDVHVELVSRLDYDTALSQLAASLAANESLSAELAWSENDSRDQSKEIAALREELESTKAALREEMKDAFEFQQKNAALIELLSETSDYLDGSTRNAVWCDSILHKKMKTAPNKPEEAKS